MHKLCSSNGVQEAGAVEHSRSDTSRSSMDYSDGVTRASTPDSLFDEIADPLLDDTAFGHSSTTVFADEDSTPLKQVLAHREAPSIPGLFFDPALRLPIVLVEEVMNTCLETFFKDNNVNQVMLFGRARHPCDTASAAQDNLAETRNYGLPTFLQSLLLRLDELLKPMLPSKTHRLLFPPAAEAMHARQAIINLYHPGEGISPHVDLLRRFGDGIIGVSLGSGCVMNFRQVPVEENKPSHPDADPAHAGSSSRNKQWDLYLPKGSVLVLSEEARYRWTHGIERQTRDFVSGEAGIDEGRWIDRGLRVSITFRWLLPGADIVGGDGV